MKMNRRQQRKRRSRRPVLVRVRAALRFLRGLLSDSLSLAGGWLRAVFSLPDPLAAGNQLSVENPDEAPTTETCQLSTRPRVRPQYIAAFSEFLGRWVPLVGDWPFDPGDELPPSEGGFFVAGGLSDLRLFGAPGDYVEVSFQPRK